MHGQRTLDSGITTGASAPITKVWLIPDEVAGAHASAPKAGDRATGLAVWEWPMSYQLVGEVTAHQGNDG